MNPRCPEQMDELFAAHLCGENDLAGIINCWPLDMVAPDVENACAAADVADLNHQLGVFSVLRLVKTLAGHDTIKPRLYLITANAQPAPGTRCAPSTKPPSGVSAG